MSTPTPLYIESKISKKASGNYAGPLNQGEETPMNRRQRASLKYVVLGTVAALAASSLTAAELKLGNAGELEIKGDIQSAPGIQNRRRAQPPAPTKPTTDNGTVSASA
jgi:hypothetical protein